MTEPELEYGFVEALSEYWDNQMPDAIIASRSAMREICSDLGTDPLIVRSGDGFVGYLIGVAVWIDERFDRPIFISAYG